MMRRLLITARDPAAALHLIEVIRALREAPHWSVSIAAQSPAAGYLAAAGIAFEKVDLLTATDPAGADGRALLERAARILADSRPDAVLCGLSTPFDGGIDEAVLQQARVPSFLLQDFWGEQNRFFGRGADRLLVLDEEAVRLSRARHGDGSGNPVIVGSPRHAGYARLDLAGTRRALRRARGIDPATQVIGFFGQALHKNPGYVRTVAAWARAVRQLPSPLAALYKPHPRERDKDRESTLELFAATGLKCIYAGDWSVEEALLFCDVACSAFSNCTYDAAYLNRFSDEPLVTPVSLFFDPEVVAYFRRIVHLHEFPYLKAGLVLPVYDEAALRDKLSEAARPEAKHQFWQAARSQLLDPTDAPLRVLGAIDCMLSGKC